MINFKVTSRNRVEELRQELRPRAGRVINFWARNVLAIADQLVNVGDRNYIDDEGDRHPEALRRSGEIVNYANTRGDGRQRGVAKSVRYSKSYAGLVHDGWAYYEGNPFLLAAFEATRGDLVRDLNDIFKL